jgi:hypothetical protein
MSETTQELKNVEDIQDSYRVFAHHVESFIKNTDWSRFGENIRRRMSRFQMDVMKLGESLNFEILQFLETNPDREEPREGSGQNQTPPVRQKRKKYKPTP